MLFTDNEDGSFTIRPEEGDEGKELNLQAVVFNSGISPRPKLGVLLVTLHHPASDFAKKAVKSFESTPQQYECASQGCGCEESCGETVGGNEYYGLADWIQDTRIPVFPASKEMMTLFKGAADAEGVSGVNKRRDDAMRKIFE